MSVKNQFVLLRERRFAPLFWVQFLGAANDNVFKFAFTLLATYAAARWGNVDPRLAMSSTKSTARKRRSGGDRTACGSMGAAM